MTNVVKLDDVEKQEADRQWQLDYAWTATGAMFGPDDFLRDPNDRSRFDECKRVIIDQQRRKLCAREGSIARIQ